MVGTNAAILPSLDCENIRNKKFAITVHPVLPIKIRSCIAREEALEMLRRSGNHEVTAVRLRVVCCRRVLNFPVLQASLVSLRKGSELFSVLLPN